MENDSGVGAYLASRQFLRTILNQARHYGHVAFLGCQVEGSVSILIDQFIYS